MGSKIYIAYDMLFAKIFCFLIHYNSIWLQIRNIPTHTFISYNKFHPVAGTKFVRDLYETFKLFFFSIFDETFANVAILAATYAYAWHLLFVEIFDQIPGICVPAPRQFLEVIIH